jgi:hypothetical protein
VAMDAEQSVVRELRSPRAAGVAGLVFAALFVAAFLLMRHGPASGSTPAEVARFYLRTNERRLAVVQLYLAPFAGIAFLWFIAVIRDRIGAHEDRFFSTVFLGSGLVFVAMLFAAVAAGGAPLAGVRFQGSPAPSPDAVVLSRGIAYSLLYIYGMRVAAVFITVVSTISLRLGTVPRWLAAVGFALALVLLFGVSFSRWSVLLFPAWVAAVSIAILVRRGDEPAAAVG